MGLKNIFQSRQRKSAGVISIVPRLEAYLLAIQDEGNDRAKNVISPSAAGNCPRAQVINRFLVRDKVTPRVQRIFDNGTDAHIRYQRYLKRSRTLLLDEVPLRQDEYNVQGHTDGYLYDLGLIPKPWWKWVKKRDLPAIYDWLSNNPLKSVEILEIKTINDGQYKALRTAKEEHKDQATTYAWCAETRRKQLVEMYSSWDSFIESEDKRGKEHRKNYKFLSPKKLKKKVFECLLSDAILFATQNPVERVVYVYENKNDQNIAEFVLKAEETRLSRLKKTFKCIESACAAIKKAAKKHEVDFLTPRFSELLPDKLETARGRTCALCKWCNHKDVCYPKRG